MKWPAVVVLSLFATTLSAGEPARIIYTKYFKGSVPEFVAITIDKSGKATYKEATDDPLPLQFQIPASQTNEIFDMAEKLGKFSRPLESELKVAHMGIKTFRFEDGTVKNEVKFNYSEDPDARALGDWFERISETEQVYTMLERAVKYDRLGINQATLLIMQGVERNRLVAPEQFLPLLDRVAKNETFMHMARERAATLAELFRNPTPPKAEK